MEVPAAGTQCSNVAKPVRRELAAKRMNAAARSPRKRVSGNASTPPCHATQLVLIIVMCTAAFRHPLIPHRQRAAAAAGVNKRRAVATTGSFLQLGSWSSLSAPQKILWALPNTINSVPRPTLYIPWPLIESKRFPSSQTIPIRPAPCP